MTLWVFVRHGEARCNTAGLLVGPPHSPLTSVGCRQAQLAADALTHVIFDKVLCSPYARAVQTVERLTPHAPLVCPGLAERRFGRFSTRTELAAAGWDHTRTAWSASPPGGETLGQATARALAVLDHHDGASAVLVVSHAGVLRGILGLIDGTAPAERGQRRIPFAEPIHRTVAVGTWALHRSSLLG